MELEIPKGNDYLLRAEAWRHDNAETTFYKEVCGASPEFTNHLSYTRIEVINGSGRVALGGVTCELEAGSVVIIKPGSRYAYEGIFDSVTTVRPGFNEKFVTIGDEPLGKSERKTIRRILRRAIHRHVIKQAARIVGDMDVTMAVMGGSLRNETNEKV